MAEDSPDERQRSASRAAQVLAARVAPEGRSRRCADALAGGGWHELSAEDGDRCGSTSAQVVYVRTERDEHRVGFGLG